MSAPQALPEVGVGPRRNKRGDATRASILTAAITALASGDPAAVSANHVAKQSGMTWGTVKYQFGDVDGFWAAVLDHIEERQGDFALRTNPADPLAVRVEQIVTTLWHGLDAEDGRAIDNLRAALPRDREELERAYPLTAAAFHRFNDQWGSTIAQAFADLDLDAEKAQEIASLIPGALRGLLAEQGLGTYVNTDAGRRGLVRSLVAYVS